MIGKATMHRLGQYVRNFAVVIAASLIAACSGPQQAGAAPYSRTFIEFSHTFAGATALDVAGYTFTIHDTNGNRLTCAELELVDTPKPSAAPTTAVPATAVPTVAVPTAEAPPANAGVIAAALVVSLGITAASAYVGFKFAKRDKKSTEVSDIVSVESKL